MKLLTWLTKRLTNCSGKISSSVLRTAGIATVVGVAGLGAYSLLSSPEQDPLSAPSSYNPGEVVYVAGNPNGGAYQSASYNTGRLDTERELNKSSVHFTAKTLNRLQEAENREKAMAEMAEYEESNRPSASRAGSAYLGGDTEGLGMGANVANEMGLKNADLAANPMSALQGVMGNMQGMISKAQQQAQGTADKAAPSGEKPAAGALQLATMAKAGNSGGGSSSFVIQNSGKNAKDLAGQAAQVGSKTSVFAETQGKIASALDGARMRAKASFGDSDGLGGSKDAEVMKGGVIKLGDTKGGRDLEYIMKHSNKVAMNKNRSATDAADPFLSDKKISGGMRITSENINLGDSQGSKDFESGVRGAMKGLKGWKDAAMAEDDAREQDRSSLKTWLFVALGVAAAACVAIPFLRHVAIIGPILALVAACVATAVIAMGLMKAIMYMARWGGNGLSITATVVTTALISAVWITYALTHAAAKKQEEMAKRKLFIKTNPLKTL